MSEDKTTKTVEDDAAVGGKTEVEVTADQAEAAKAEDAKAAKAEDAEAAKAEDAVEVDDVETTADADADESGDGDDADAEAGSDTPKRRIQWSRLVAFVVLPALALVLALGAGYLKWQDSSNRRGEISASPSGQPSLAEQSVRVARDTTVALLSYKPDTVEKQLGDARNLLTGEFRDSYTSLTNDVVIPGAKEQQISAVASVPAAASVSVSPTQAVVLVFVNQTVTVGQSAPTDTASSVRVTLDKVGDRWLISTFEPV